MPRPRYSQISLLDTPYYHCVSRCVRRAFLCGEDSVSRQSYEHRRQWIEDQLYSLARVFAIDVCAYAVMSNHYHVVLYVDADQAKGWTRDEVIERWHRLFNGTVQSRLYCVGGDMSQGERDVLDECVALWRDRLMDISWWMRVLNESIARQANAEDGCTGRFWEGRFRCQALLDEAALAACMAYVDLNPIRAGMAERPEDSDHTSIRQRCEQANHAFMPNHPQQQVKGLMPFVGNPRTDIPKGLPFRLTDYIELVDWTGRILRDDKRGHISNDLPPILDRLALDARQWTYLAQHFESRFKGLVGTAYTLKSVCQRLGFRRVPGLGACVRYLSPG